MHFDEKLMGYLFDNLRKESPHDILDLLMDNIGRGGLAWYIYLLTALGVIVIFVSMTWLLHVYANNVRERKRLATLSRAKRTYLV